MGKFYNRISWWPLVKVVASLLFAGIVAIWIDWRRLGEVAAGIVFSDLFISLGFVGLGEVLIAARLKLLMRPMKLQLPLRRLLRIGLIARFYGIFLPAGLGHLLARWYKVTENRAGRLEFAAVSLAEKLLFLLTTLLSVALPLWLVNDPAVAHLRGVFLSGMVLLGGLLLLFYLSVLWRSPAGWLGSAVKWLLGRVGGPARDLTGVGRTLRRFCGPSRLLEWPLLLTFVLQGIILLRLSFLFRAVGVDFPWTTTLWMGSLVFFLQALPLTFWGLGVRESAFAYAFSLYGLSRESGALVGLLFLLQMILNAGLGGILEWTDRAHSTEAGG